MRWIGIDDRLDCFAAHGVGGITGSLLTGLFASIEYGASSVDGGFYGNGLLFAKQLAGVCAAVLMSVVMTTAIYWFLQGCARLFNTDIRIPGAYRYLVGCVGGACPVLATRVSMHLRVLHRPELTPVPPLHDDIMITRCR